MNMSLIPHSLLPPTPRYHGQKQRDFLVKLEIDFLKDMDDGEGGNSASHAKKDRVLGHRILPVKKKSYGKNEDEM